LFNIRFRLFVELTFLLVLSAQDANKEIIRTVIIKHLAVFGDGRAKHELMQLKNSPGQYSCLYCNIGGNVIGSTTYYPYKEACRCSPRNHTNVPFIFSLYTLFLIPVHLDAGCIQQMEESTDSGP